jgi:hypothetical protein
MQRLGYMRGRRSIAWLAGFAFLAGAVATRLLIGNPLQAYRAYADRKVFASIAATQDDVRIGVTQV